MRYHPPLLRMLIFKNKKQQKKNNLKDTWTPMFTATLFATAKLWKLQCPRTNAWIKNMWCVDRISLLSCNKRWTIVFAKTWIMLSKINQKEKGKYYMILLMKNIMNAKGCVFKKRKGKRIQRNKQN